MYRTIVKIGWSSLSRRKSRSIMVVVMITLCFWGILVLEGFYDGMTEQIIDNAIRSSSGHITIYARDYRLEKGLAHRIEKVERIDHFLQEQQEVHSSTVRVIQDALLATAHSSRNGVLQGIDLEAEKQHGRLDEFLVEGDYSFGDEGWGVLLGAKLAENLQAKIGGKVILSAQNSNDEIVATALRVKGILRTNNMGLDETAIFIDIAAARNLLEIGDTASRIAVLVHDEVQIDPVITRLKNRFPELDVFRWDILYPALMQSRTMMKVFNLVTSMIVFFVAGLGIFGVMLVSVLERVREFGVMMAIGTRFSQIAGLVMVEALSMSLLGFIAGGLLGGLSLLYCMQVGVDLSVFSEGLDAFGLNTVIYGIIRPEYYLTGLLAIVCATVVSVLQPLWVLRKSRPIESINRT